MKTKRDQYKKERGRMLFALLAFVLEVFLLRGAVPLFADEAVMLWLTPFFGAAFGFYFVFAAKEKLPALYDQYKVNFYSDGILRMNMPGVYFNNNNWPHILNAIRTWACLTLGGWVAVYAAVRLLLNAAGAPEMVQFGFLLPITLFEVLGGMMLPLYVVGKKYQ